MAPTSADVARMRRIVGAIAIVLAWVGWWFVRMLRKDLEEARAERREAASRALERAQGERTGGRREDR
jgi:hypothetical protein